MDSELREALTRAAAPVEIGPDERHRVSDAIAADRRRRTTMFAIGGTIAAVAAIGVGVTVIDDGHGDNRSGVTDRGGPNGSSGWEQVAASPLAPRDQAVAVWTGSEVIVVGGTTGRPCPPDADCALPPKSAERADAAAYDPETDTWRRLSPAPVAFADGYPVWSDDRLVVVSGRLTLIYDPASDTWERLIDLPDDVPGGGLVATDDGPVRFAYQQTPGSGAEVDWRLDPATREWSPLPRDPFGESYDRSMTWYDGRLWLLSMPVENHFAAHEGASSRLAVLDGGTWTVVDEETPDLTYDQRLVQHQGSFVIAAGSYRSDLESHAFDPETEEWRTLPGSDAAERGCPLGDAIVGPDWVASARGLVSAASAETRVAPPCPEMPEPAVTVWAGARLFIWGGPNREYDGNLADGLVWTPPPPE